MLCVVPVLLTGLLPVLSTLCQVRRAVTSRSLHSSGGEPLLSALLLPLVSLRAGSRVSCRSSVCCLEGHRQSCSGEDVSSHRASQGVWLRLLSPCLLSGVTVRAADVSEWSCQRLSLPPQLSLSPLGRCMRSCRRRGDCRCHI